MTNAFIFELKNPLKAGLYRYPILDVFIPIVIRLI